MSDQTLIERLLVRAPCLNPEGNKCAHHPDDPAHGQQCAATEDDLLFIAMLELLLAARHVEPLTPAEIRMAGQRAGMMKAAEMAADWSDEEGSPVGARIADAIRKLANPCRCPEDFHDLSCPFAVPE
jgi:hypothetical protein